MNEFESPLVELVRQKRVIIVLGAGGVGKTTSSMALGVLGARLGKKVGLLSIDPAKRLARAMGLSLGSRLSEVRFAEESGVEGQLFAAMLDQKAVFDDMVRRFARSEKIATRIFQNSVYKEVSTNLGGPLEYMAVAKLEEMIGDPSYDLIVLDTPPDTHALDFLVRPNVLAGFMENRVMTWLIRPFYIAQKLGAGRLISAGEKLMGGIASVTGVKALQTLAEFLVLMEDVISGFNQSGQRVTATLQDSRAGFLLVASPKSSAVRSAMSIAAELERNTYALDALLINRYMPRRLQESLAVYENLSEALTGPLARGLDALAVQLETADALVGELVASIAARFGTKVPTLLVDEQDGMIHSTEAMLELTRAFERATLRPVS